MRGVQSTGRESSERCAQQQKAPQQEARPVNRAEAPTWLDADPAWARRDAAAGAGIPAVAQTTADREVSRRMKMVVPLELARHSLAESTRKKLQNLAFRRPDQTNYRCRESSSGVSPIPTAWPPRP